MKIRYFKSFITDKLLNNNYDFFTLRQAALNHYEPIILVKKYKNVNWDSCMNLLVDIIGNEVRNAIDDIIFKEFSKYHNIDEVYIIHNPKEVNKLNRFNSRFIFDFDTCPSIVGIPLYNGDMENFEINVQKFKSKNKVPDFFHMGFMYIKLDDFIIKTTDNKYWIINLTVEDTYSGVHYLDIDEVTYLHELFNDNNEDNVKINNSDKSLKDLIIEYNYYNSANHKINLIYKNNKWIL